MNEEEKLEFEDQEEEQPIEIPPKERRVYSDKADRSIFELYRQYQKGNLDLQPGFQRLQVWDNSKSSRLIESVLLEVPIPVIYLSEESDGKYSVIDGQQRLNAFFKFLENRLRLSGLTILVELNGKRFQDIPKNLQDKFENATIRIIEIRKESAPDVKFEIFERLNTGSVQLNAQELRNCIYRGRYNELLKELSGNKDFQFLLGLKEPHNRMQDRELILRFFAFYHNTYLKYTPPMKRFLNKEMEKYRNLNEAEENELRNVFKKSVRLSKTVFGDKAFHRFVVGSKEDPNGYYEKKINKGLFDIIMFGFTMYDDNQIVPNSDIIREELLWMMTHEEDFVNAISGSGTDSKEKTVTRFDKWLQALKKIVGTPKTKYRNFSLQYKKQLWESNPTCAICGQKIHIIDDAEVDHIEQYWRGGKTIPLNARLTHRYCNRSRPRDDIRLDTGEKVDITAPTIHISQKRPNVKYPRVVSKGEKTPRQAFRIPILEALVELGGKGKTDEILEKVELKMKHILNSVDYEKLPSGVMIRWQNTAQWERYVMVKDGLLRSDSPKGIWEITEKGRKFLKNSKRQKATNGV
jgi:predicted transcriptional regulator